MLTEATTKPGGIVADRPLGPDELAKMLGYSRASLKQMRTNKSKLIEGLPMFKLCNCAATRRKTQTRCNHPFYAWKSEVMAFLKAKQERYGQMTAKFP